MEKKEEKENILYLWKKCKILEISNNLLKMLKYGNLHNCQNMENPNKMEIPKVVKIW